MPSSSLGARGCIHDLARLVHHRNDVRIFQRRTRYQVNLAGKQLLQCVLQSKVAIEQFARVVRKEFDQKINMAVP